MAGALIEVWLAVSALSSLIILLIALGNSDMRTARWWSRRTPRLRRRRETAARD
ncbi:hypothetical protein [Sphingomonas sp.]|uniref:hypothetical protein n=1 Tax=Sphingomonas sp. TaxID=28214 RepID=UPI0031D55748